MIFRVGQPQSSLTFIIVVDFILVAIICIRNDFKGHFCVCLTVFCGWSTCLMLLSEKDRRMCVYAVTYLLLSGSQISRAELTDKTALSYKQCYMKSFHKSCMTFQSNLPCHFSGWHFWWDGKTKTCTMWLKGLTLPLIPNLSLLQINLKVKRN